MYSFLIFRDYAIRLSSVPVRTAIVRQSGLVSHVITMPGVNLEDGRVQDQWLPAIFNRVMGAIFVDSDKSVASIQRVLDRLLSLSSMEDLLPEEDIFGGLHPNQFFTNHCLKIGTDVEYKVEDLGPAADLTHRYRCTTHIHGKALSTGYGISISASRSSNLERMRLEPQFLEYCRELRDAFGRAHTVFHSYERMYIPENPLAFITEFFRCTKKEVEGWLITLQLGSDRYTTKKGVLVTVPRVLSVLFRNSAVESLSIRPTHTAANRTTLERYGASLSHRIPMDTLVRYDYVLMRADVLSTVSVYYPRLPYSLDVVRPYLHSGHPERVPSPYSPTLDVDGSDMVIRSPKRPREDKKSPAE